MDNFFGERLRSKRKSFKLSQAELADKIGCSKGLIGDIERGTRNITKNTAVKLADVFNTDPLFWLDKEKEIERLVTQDEFTMLFDILEELKKNNLIVEPDDIRKPAISEMLLSAIELGLEIQNKKNK